MNLFKLRRILTCWRKKGSDSATESKPQTIAENDKGDEEPYGGLSEVAAPIPVERTTEEEQARHESLDSNLSGGSHSHPHLSNN
ncbi:hypothetical protein N7517_000767 [Penicillium concentricum]|uniref:Uncharacterized protein n=1 Tax=Penicillium concentricum TaxID=293559 RepID=A0A9W9VKJ8_9EURO|nr:uncharacterized protein N7517_000767 [Penicillium concentricum]KAJ5382856.1 hypothetical protein N7517_000767 [Penicillium concentricum]